MRSLPLIFAKDFLSHTAITGYGGRLIILDNKSHNCLQAFMLYLSIFITLPVAIIFPSHNSNLFPIDRFILITDIGAQTISPGKTVPILLKFIWQW